MARLIDATRIEQYILNNCSDNEEINAIYAEIINAPTMDAVRHGRWQVNEMFRCSTHRDRRYRSAVLMFTVETLKGEEWKKDRVYKLFQNAEKRVYTLYHEGINARMIERKR